MRKSGVRYKDEGLGILGFRVGFWGRKSQGSGMGVHGSPFLEGNMME